jgi:glycine cleavage system H protein
MSKKLYSASDEWVLIEGLKATIGITHYAQDQLGDIVFIDLPQIGKFVELEGSFGAVESVKAAADLYAPIKGKVISVNERLLASPELLNKSPEDTFIIELEIDINTDISHLMTHDAYLASK